MMLNKGLDTESYIFAITRPCLWDLSSDEYSNRVLKKKMWEEVTLILGGNDCATPNEKSDFCE